MQIFITGTDTDAGKTYATAHLAKLLAQDGSRVITQKFIQTGNTGHSEDIDAHRRLTGTGPLPEDALGLTAPVILSYPASAQLAARIDGVTIDLDAIDRARARLAQLYDHVLVEGAGGLMVPVTDDFFTVDYIATRGLPVALVTNSRLGSINHTVLTLQALGARGIPVRYILYNTWFDGASAPIAQDTRAFIGRYAARHHPGAQIIDIPVFG